MLHPYPDGFFNMSLQSILLTVLDGCVLPADNMVSVLNMVSNCRFIARVKAFSDAFFASILCKFQSCSKETRSLLTNVCFVAVVAWYFIHTVTDLAYISLVFWMNKTVA